MRSPGGRPHFWQPGVSPGAPLPSGGIRPALARRGPKLVLPDAHSSGLAGRPTRDDAVTSHRHLLTVEDHRHQPLKMSLRFAVQLEEATTRLARRFRQQRRALRPRGDLFYGLLEEIFRREDSAANRIQEVANAAAVGRDDRYPPCDSIDDDQWLLLP